MDCRMANTVNAVTHSLYYDRVNSVGPAMPPAENEPVKVQLWIMKPGAVPARSGRRGAVRNSSPPTAPSAAVRGETDRTPATFPPGPDRDRRTAR
jgi:hypothetical protein